MSRCSATPSSMRDTNACASNDIGAPKRPARSIGRDRGEVRQQSRHVARGEVAIRVLGASCIERAPVVARRRDRLLDSTSTPAASSLEASGTWLDGGVLMIAASGRTTRSASSRSVNIGSVGPASAASRCIAALFRSTRPASTMPW